MTTLALGTIVNVDLIGHCKVIRIDGDSVTLKEIVSSGMLKDEHQRPVAWCEKRIVG